VCGEALIDLVQPDSASRDSFTSMWLALSAGGPMNSAVALGKLGADTHFLGRLFRDAFGSPAPTAHRRSERPAIRSWRASWMAM
jgi:sugar/nucleoside kinase (ribokinase family)